MTAAPDTTISDMDRARADLYNFLGALLAKQGADALGPRDLRLDGALMPGAATLDLVEQLEQAGPFGAGAPGPRFAFGGMRILNARRVGENHLKISFGETGGARLDGIAFGAYDSALGPAIEAHGGAPFHLAGRLDINSYQGRQSVQLQLEDAAPA